MAWTPKKETERMRDAFAYYHDMGPSRNMDAVAKMMKVSQMTISRWSSAFHWTNRVADLAEKEGEHPDLPVTLVPLPTIQELRSEIIELRATLRTAITGLTIIGEDGVPRLKVEITTASDVHSIVKAYKEIVDLDIRLSTLKDRSDESSRVSELRDAVLGFIRHSSQSERMGMLRKLNTPPSAIPVDAEFVEVGTSLNLLDPDTATEDAADAEN